MLARVPARMSSFGFTSEFWFSFSYIFVIFFYFFAWIYWFFLLLSSFSLFPYRTPLLSLLSPQKKTRKFDFLRSRDPQGKFNAFYCVYEKLLGNTFSSVKKILSDPFKTASSFPKKRGQGKKPTGITDGSRLQDNTMAIQVITNHRYPTKPQTDPANKLN